MKVQWVIFIVFMVTILQSWVFGKWLLKGIQYDRFFSMPAVFQGEDVEMVERITNRKLLPVPWLRVESKISQNLQFKKQYNLDIKHAQFHKSLFSLMPYTGISRRHKVHCIKRGCYRLNSVALTCGDLLGVRDISKEYELSAQLLVYPKFIPLEDIPFFSRSWLGDVVVKRWIVEDPFMYAGIRNYSPGDPLNHINWKATARTGQLQVHKRDYTADPNIMIYLNLDIDENMWEAVTEPERIERGISYAASIARDAISQGIDAGFGCNGYVIDEPGSPIRITPGSGEGQMLFLLETMAKLVIERSVTFHTFLEEDISKGISGIDFLFITASINQRIENQIKRLKDHGNSVEILWLHPDDGERDQKNG